MDMSLASMIKQNLSLANNNFSRCEISACNTMLAEDGDLLEDDFDRSVCEHNAPWNTKKLLKLTECFYIGGDLKIIEYK